MSLSITAGKYTANASELGKSVSDILTSVPVCLRGALKPLFERTYDQAVKYWVAVHAFENFSQMKDAGTFPMSLNALRCPTIQFCKEYELDSGKQCRDDMGRLLKDVRTTFLDRFIQVKQLEYLFLQENYLGSEIFKERMVDVVSKASADAKAAGINIEKDEAEGLKYSQFFRNNIMHIAKARVTNSAETQRRKKEKKVEADVSMAKKSG